MKKILLLMTMVLTCVGAWAQAELDGYYVTFTNVQKNGTEFSLYVNDQKQLVISRDPAAELGEYSKFICTKVNNQYTFYNEKAGVYMIWRNGGTNGYDNGDGTMATYDPTYCNWTLRSSSNYPGGYYIVSKRADGTSPGAIVLMSTGVFDAYGDSEGWANNYSNVFRIEKVGEANKSFNWNTLTSWTDANDLPSTVLNDNALGYGIKYIEQEMSVDGARTATVTFQYTGGSCALNVRGVEVIDSEGRIVAGDYHVGKTGNAHTDNVYTVKVAEGGTYTVRCYATFGAKDRADATNGNITVAFDKAEISDFSHDVNFAAEYATLHLGYKAAIPAGVEAYVVESASNGWAHMEKIENVIPAATPVILKNVGNSNEYTFTYTETTPAAVPTNLLKGSIVDRYVAENAYVLSNGDDGLGLYRASMNQLNYTAFKNNANKAYLLATAVTSGVKALRFNFDGETTAIETVETENANAPIYDLSGRRVLTTAKGGIYIQNGKKFIVK